MNKYETIESALKALANEETASQMAAYMRNQFRFFGIKTPERRAVTKKLIASDKKSGTVDWEFTDRCWDSEYRELQYVALDYMKGMCKYIRFEDVPKLEKYVRSKQWWDSIDFLHGIFGHIGLTDKRIKDLMLKWSVDNDFWVRRIAIDHQIGMKDKTDTELLDKILVNNFNSKEFFINKAIGWSLRDYSKTNPAWVNDFIERHRASLSNLSLRKANISK